MHRKSFRYKLSWVCMLSTIGSKRLCLRKLIFLCLLASVVVYVNIAIWIRPKGRGIVFLEELPDLLEDEPQRLLSSHNNATNICPKMSPYFVGPVFIDKTRTDLANLTKVHSPYRPGGHFKPKECISRTKTAIIIPYRNREHHLLVLLNHLIPFLVRQQTEFAIFVVEPVSSVTFNRALLLNIGFVEALKNYNYTCFVFHDVDLLPESDYNLYRCGGTARHMAVSNSKYGYELLFPEYVGGVTAMSRDIYEEVNGHSNLFFGWGGEDDDMLNRLLSKKHLMSRYPADVGVYFALSHNEDRGNPVNEERDDILLSSSKRMEEDGLNSLKYDIVKKEYKQLYTWILVSIDISYYNRALSKWRKRT